MAFTPMSSNSPLVPQPPPAPTPTQGSRRDGRTFFMAYQFRARLSIDGLVHFRAGSNGVEGHPSLAVGVFPLSPCSLLRWRTTTSALTPITTSLRPIGRRHTCIAPALSASCLSASYAPCQASVSSRVLLLNALHLLKRCFINAEPPSFPSLCSEHDDFRAQRQCRCEQVALGSILPRPHRHEEHGHRRCHCGL